MRRDLTAVFPRLIQGLTARDDWETALSHARRWLTLDEFNEAAHRAVMRLYAHLGQRAAAEEQQELWNALQAPPAVTHAQKHLGDLMRGEA